MAGTTTQRYVWSPVYVDALNLRDRDTDANGSLDERLWVMQDANWNVVGLVNASGVVVERYAYDAFGAVTVMNGSWTVIGSSAYGWVHGHQGLRLDLVGYDNRWRILDPVMGRFRNMDPIRYDAGDVVLYAYVSNNPLVGLDPTGLEREEPFRSMPWIVNASRLKPAKLGIDDRETTFVLAVLGCKDCKKAKALLAQYYDGVQEAKDAYKQAMKWYNMLMFYGKMYKYLESSLSYLNDIRVGKAPKPLWWNQQNGKNMFNILLDQQNIISNIIQDKNGLLIAYEMATAAYEKSKKNMLDAYLELWFKACDEKSVKAWLTPFNEDLPKATQFADVIK